MAPQQRELIYFAILPQQRQTGKSSTVTTEVFAIRISVRALSLADNLPPFVDVGRSTVGSPQSGCGDVEERSPEPQDSVLCAVRNDRHTSNHANIVDRTRLAKGRRRGAEIGDGVVSFLCLRSQLHRHWCDHQAQPGCCRQQSKFHNVSFANWVTAHSRLGAFRFLYLSTQRIEANQ